MHGDGQILIFRQRFGGKSAKLLQHAFAPRADRAGNDGECAERGQRAALQILRHDIFQRLPARNHVDAIADLCIAGDGADLLVGEPAYQPGDGVLLELGVGIERDDDVAARARQRRVEGVCLAGILDGNELDPRVGCKIRGQHLEGFVFRTIVDDDDVEIAVGTGENAAHGIGDDALFIIGGDDHRNVEWVFPGRGLLRERFAAPVPQAQAGQEDEP